MEEHWPRKQDPPPTFKGKLIRLLVNVWGVILTVFVILAALAVVRNFFMYGGSIVD